MKKEAKIPDDVMEIEPIDKDDALAIDTILPTRVAHADRLMILLRSSDIALIDVCFSPSIYDNGMRSTS